MRSYSFTDLSDGDLVRRLTSVVKQDCVTTAEMLALIAEVDVRKLYLPAAYPSMFAYCVHELRLSEDSAAKRIQAARTAWQFPALFVALAKGHLHLSAVCRLAPHLTPENADELLKAATHKTKSEIEKLLAQRFPRTETLPMVMAMPGSSRLRDAQHAPGHVGLSASEHAPGHVEASAQRPKVVPVAPERFLLQVSIGCRLRDKLRHAQELASHQIAPGDVAELVERSIDLLIAELEQRKFAATSRPRTVQRRATSKRTIPAHVKRVVWERDGGRCTFVSETGHRCASRRLPEFDHIDPVARGGEATVDGMRLLCHAHNQCAIRQVWSGGRGS
jgi:hypothetical protein